MKGNGGTLPIAVARTPERRAPRAANRFRVLGPLEAVAGDEPIPLGGRRQREVLALLIARANAYVPVEQLIDDVWGEEPPDSARNLIQGYVSRLRKALGTERIEGGSHGYRLRMDPAELDATRFDALVRDARRAMPVDPSLATGILEDALALWRGPALGDLAREPPLVAEATRLDELRSEAQEARVEGLLATGAQVRAIAELEVLLTHHPLRERLWELLMLALYREGRQAEALDAYRRAREILAEELGIDPSPELARLHEQVLRQDPALDLHGEPLRGYRLLEQIGEGPTGAVFRAIQPHVERDVAIKTVHERIAVDRAFVRSFEPRAQAAAALEHPHIVPVYDYWREPSGAYIVSRYLRGGSLRAMEERGERFDQDRAVRLLEQIASALAFAHRQGVAHGHVSTANILFDEEGNAYLSDFADGARSAPDPADDVRELAALCRRLAPRAEPLHEQVERIEWEAATVSAETVVEAARKALRQAPALVSEEDVPRNPYKGLRAFTEADGSDFFGRNALVARLLARLSESHDGSRLLAVVGPSGSGKSSVVRAGVVPAIRHGALGDASDVFVTDLVPGSHPIDELESALLRISLGPAPRLRDRLESGSRGLLDAIDLVTPGEAQVVLVVDQFEETFTLTATEAERELFLEELRVATVDRRSRIRVILTLRADFYDRPLVYPRFAEMLAEGTEAVPPLVPDELEQAIRRPSERVGVSIEPGLVAEMIGDVAHEPGGLPLLQYALTELFERREADQLTLSAYREMGGVAGSLSARAERILGTTGRAGRKATRQVLLRLVTLGEGRPDTRRRVARRELDALGVDRETVDVVLDTFGRHRLLTFDREPSTREPTVEIAHEALLTRWARLRTWIDRARDDLRQNQRLSQAAAEWRGSGCEPSFLLHGARLEQVESWAAGSDLAMGLAEREYLKASRDERDREEEEDRVSQERETQLERRSVRRLRDLVAVLAAAALVAATLTVIATNQRERAGEEAARAERAAGMARVRELIAASGASRTTDSDRGILLAIEAVELARSTGGSVPPEAEEALHLAIAAQRSALTVPGIGGVLAWAPTGVFAVEGARGSGTVELRDGSTGDRLLAFGAHEGRITDVAFSPDGALLATAGTDGLLKVWDPVTRRLISSVPGRGPATGVSFDGDGARVAASWPRKGGLARVADPITGDVLRTIHHLAGERVAGTALSPDGDRVALGGSELAVVDLVSGERVIIARPFWGTLPPSWSPDGRFITAPIHAGVWVFDARSGKRVERVQGVGGDVTWSPDARQFAAPTSGDGTVEVWSVQRGGTAQQTLTLTAGEMDRPIVGLAFSADGAALMVGDDRASTVKVWNLEPRDYEWASFPTRGLYWSDVEYMPDGEAVASNAYGFGTSVRVWNVGSGRPVRRVGYPGGPGVVSKEASFDVSPDGRSIVIISGSTARVYDVESGEEILPMRRDGSVSASWSPDGELLAVAGSDGLASIVDRSGRTVQELPTRWGRVFDARFAPGGRLLAVTNGSNYPIVVWDWERAEIVAELTEAGSYEITWDPTGSRILTSVGDVWDVATEERVMGLADDGWAIRLTYSPDGARIARASLDGGVGLFDARTGEELFVLRGDCPVAGVDFGPDGSRLVTVDACFEVRVWAHSVDDLLDLAHQTVTRTLTAAECRGFLGLASCEAEEPDLLTGAAA